MTLLSDFAVTRRWPARYPDRIQLYSLATPNGVKIAIMLEEIGCPYEVHRVDFAAKDQKTPEFLALNPNGKIPAIIDPSGPNGLALALYESGAILLYLADKYCALIPADPALRYEAIQWLMWQVSQIGPMFGQVGYFWKFEGREIEDQRPLMHYAGEAKRLLGVLDRRLEDREWVMGESFTIADVSLIGMVRNLVEFYKAGELVDYASFQHIRRWLAHALLRPGVERGLKIPSS